MKPTAKPDRLELAYKLRMEQGKPLSEIGALMGVSEARVDRMVRQWKRELQLKQIREERNLEAG